LVRQPLAVADKTNEITVVAALLERLWLGFDSVSAAIDSFSAQPANAYPLLGLCTLKQP
jgi:hypothetical protein